MLGITPYTTSSGEEWRTISYPFFRISNKPHANRWISSWGRLMQVDGEIIERRRRGDGYHQTTVCVSRLPGSDEDCIIGVSIHVGVHHLVVYTFIGNKTHPDDTVDHVDGDPSNNFVGNLRWASSSVQLENRMRVHREFTLPDGTPSHSIVDTARRDSDGTAHTSPPYEVNDSHSLHTHTHPSPVLMPQLHGAYLQ